MSLSWPANVIDELELWQLATYFTNDEERPAVPGDVPGTGPAAADFTDLMARVAAYKAGLPDPAETTPTSFNPIFAELLGVPTVE